MENKQEIMSVNSRVLRFENLSPEYLPFSFAGKLLGFDIFYLFISARLFNHPWFKRIQRFLSTRKYADKQSTYHEKIQVHVKAVEHIERIYDENCSRGALLKEVVRRIGDGIDFSYKKALIEIVRSYLTNMQILSLFQKENPDAHISFVPDHFLKVQQWLKKIEVQAEGKEGVAISVFSRAYRGFLTIFNHIKWFGIFLIFPVWIFSKIRRISFKRMKRVDCQVGLRVYKTAPSFLSKQRSIDFLVDGTSLNKGNTIFCVETQISDSYKEELNKRGYKTAYI